MSMAHAFAERTFQYEGKDYKLVPPNLKTCGYFESYLNRSAIEAVETFFAKRDSYAQAMDATLRRIQARFYEWRNQGWAECMSSPRHFRELVLIVLKQTHDREASQELVERIFEDETTFVDSGRRDQKTGEPIMLRLWDKIVADLWELINRPNSLAPSAQAKPVEEDAAV